MQCFVFNIRKPIFQDRRVREALGYAFDFEWSNKNLFYGQYIRTKSFFDNSELASSGLPSPEELKILEPFRGKIPDEVFTKAFTLPTTDGSGNNRANLRQADALLKPAGWIIKDGKRVNKETGEALQLRDPAGQSPVRAHRPALRPESEAPGHRCRGPHRRFAAIHSAPRSFDFDMAVGGLRRIPLARQRAALFLGLGRRRSRPAAPISSASRIRSSTL